MDHAMIYVLIAGTYTPILPQLSPGGKSPVDDSAHLIIGLAGVTLMLLWF